jgi:cobalt-zinc-cadmium efflux system membrane fusion protein
MTVNLNKKQGIAILMVLAIGALLAFLILGLNSSAVSADTHGTDSHAEAGGHDDDKAHAEEGHEEPDHEEASVTMSEQQMKQNGVELGTAGPARLNSTLQLIGAIHVNEDRMVHIVPRLSGIVESVSANAGDTVRKGQVLAVISSHALADQRSESIAAQQRLALARTTFAREKSLWEEKISAEQDYLQARNALQEADIAAQSARQKLASLGTTASTAGNLTRYEIRSPIDGTVTDKRIAIGASLKDDTTIFIVADLSTVWADIVVPAKDLNAVSTGQQATVEAIAFAHEATGTLSYVGAVVGTQTRTASARIVLPNPKGVWRPGLPVMVKLVSASVDVAIAVPVTAIQTMNDAPTVFGRHDDSFEAMACSPKCLRACVPASRLRSATAS